MRVVPGARLKIQFADGSWGPAVAVTGIQNERAKHPHVRIRYQRNGRTVENNWPLDFLRADTEEQHD